MTIEPTAPPALLPPQEAAEITQFVFLAPSSSGVLQRARELLAAAPRELAESFEQAVRSAGLQA
jgi:hypothetical protein